MPPGKERGDPLGLAKRKCHSHFEEQNGGRFGEPQSDHLKPLENDGITKCRSHFYEGQKGDWGSVNMVLPRSWPLWNVSFSGQGENNRHCLSWLEPPMKFS